MIDVKVLINTNNDGKSLVTDVEAIREFTNAAYGDGRYQVTVSFESLPRCEFPELLRTIFEFKNDFKDVLEIISDIRDLCALLIPFIKKMKGYKKDLMIKQDKKKVILIEIPDDVTEEELVEKIKEKCQINCK